MSVSISSSTRLLVPGDRYQRSPTAMEGVVKRAQDMARMIGSMVKKEMGLGAAAGLTLPGTATEVVDLTWSAAHERIRIFG